MSTHDEDYAGVGPFANAVAVTPSDTAPLAFVTRALYIGGAGDVTVITRFDQTVLFKAVPVGTVLNINVVQVKATGTAATNIVALS